MLTPFASVPFAHVPTAASVVSQWWSGSLLTTHSALLLDSSTRYRSWARVDVEVVLWCEAQALVSTTNVWHSWDCHKGPTFRHWPGKQRETVCPLLLSVSFRLCIGYPPSQLVRLPYEVQVKTDCFIRNLVVFSKLTVGFAVVLLYDRLQGLITQDLWSATAGFITDLQTETSGTNA